MSIAPLRHNEKDIKTLIDRVRALMEGRQNSHGEVTLTANGSDTSTTVEMITCSADSHVSITPMTSDAAALAASVYVVPANEQFVIHHPATSATCTYKWSMHG